MKKISIFTMAATVLIGSAMSCGVKKNEKSVEENSSNGMAVATVDITDSITVDSCKAKCEINILYPTGSNVADDSIRAWIGNRLTYYYADNSKPAFMMPEDVQGDVAAMAKVACDSLLASSRRDLDKMNGFRINYMFDYSIDTICVTPTYATYNFNSYCYLGGAHGGALAMPATFSLTDGTMLTWDNTIAADSCKSVVEMIKRGLARQFFTQESGWTMEDGLLVSPDSIKLPVAPPAFDAEGLTVIYQQYEIAPYAAGMPACVLPLDSVAPYLTPAARVVVMPER